MMAEDSTSVRKLDIPRTPARDVSAISALSPASPRENVQDLAAGLRGLKKDYVDDDIDQVASNLAVRHGVPESVAAGRPPALPVQVTRRGPRPVSPIAPHLEIPYESEVVEWDSNLRADFPEYVFRQLREYAHRHDRTQTSAILEFMAAFRDSEGRPVFHIRTAELVADRRKVSKKERQR